ncbi:MAG TPA: DUF3616 domain-containing protein, partial [Candidatus Saccharimonadales bacterium]|nr:DUF3616 domain-containing protein [Candidatus Saccharimonadales bacterium]
GASANFPYGAELTPGVYANLEPSIAGLRPFSGVVGDATNPGLTFQLRDPDSDPSSLQLSVFSSNQVVVPNANLSLTSGAGGFHTLFLNPLSVGYSWIRLVITDDDLVVTQSFLYAASGRGPAATFFHSGMSDASAAFALDANYMWVGDDENQTLKLYDRRRSGEPIAGVNFDSFLGLTDIDNGIPREVDIEGSTHVGNRIFWIGSHSLSSEADVRPNRSRLFATDIVGSGTNTTFIYRGRYDFFKEDLAAWDSGNFHGKGANYYGMVASQQAGVDPKSPDGSGFNIEGLSMAPASSTVGYLAFRAPIVPATNRNFALIIPVLNFTALAGTNLPPGSAVFGAPIELDLYGRGIRSIEGSDAGFLIVGGPAASLPGSYPVDFRLYTWTGFAGSQPQQLSANLLGLNAEAIVEIPASPWNSNTIVQLLSDNGTVIFYNDNIEAKHLPYPAFKKFRDDHVPMGNVVKPMPIIRRLSFVGSNLTITWRALQGETYRVQSCSSLPSPGWTDIAGDVLAMGPLASKTFLVTGSPRFYQVKVLP